MLVVDDIDVQVTGLFRPLDPKAPAWVGDPLAAAGFIDDLIGPLIVTPDDLVAFTDPPFAQWVVQPDADLLQPEDLGPLAAAAGALRSTMDTENVAIRGLAIEGDLAPTAATADRNVQVARALNVVPLAVLLAVSVIAVAQLARILAAARTPELEVFLARGASRRQVSGWSAVEGITVTLIGVGLGVLVAILALRAVPAGAQQGGTVVTIGALTGLAVLAALLIVTGLQVRQVAKVRAGAAATGRARQATAFGTVALTVAAAALSWAQLRRYGSPLVTSADGSLGTGLVPAAAPALMLAAAAAAALALFAPLARLVGVDGRGWRARPACSNHRVCRRRAHPATEPECRHLAPDCRCCRHGTQPSGGDRDRDPGQRSAVGAARHPVGSGLQPTARQDRTGPHRDRSCGACGGSPGDLAVAGARARRYHRRGGADQTGHRGRCRSAPGGNAVAARWPPRC